PPEPLGAILNAVLFEDGEVLESRSSQFFEAAADYVQAWHDCHDKLDNAYDRRTAWDELEQLAANRPQAEAHYSPGYTWDLQGCAQELVRVRRQQGEEIALILAMAGAKLPKPWRKDGGGSS